MAGKKIRPLSAKELFPDRKTSKSRQKSTLSVKNCRLKEPMPDTTEIIAHRGSSHLAPENTLASLRLGWQETTTCELDIHPTLDGKLLVIHDDSTQRTTGINFKVAEHPLSELQQLDAGSFKGAEWKGEKLPSLADALAAMPADKRLYIEIKAGPAVIPELARVIRASGKEGQLLLHSFNSSACVEARKALPGIPVYLLMVSRQNLITGLWSPSLDEVLLQAKQAGLAGLGFNPTAFLNAATAQRIHAAGLKLNVWTVDRVDEARQLMALGVDGLITNRPGWLKAQLAGAG
jgi:glycerophosphoryl diester phosphodiesterase